jgi:hypothetical protein
LFLAPLERNNATQAVLRDRAWRPHKENPMNKTLTWAAHERPRPLTVTLLYLAADGLYAAGEKMTRLATRVHALRQVREVRGGVVEFHACHRAGAAPEGALYVNGELVGFVDGVARL